MKRAGWMGLGAVGIVGLAIACGSTNPDPCAGLGCAFGPGTLVVRVVDSSGASIASPTFSEGAQSLSAVCETDAGQVVMDAGTCDAWHFDTLSIGSHTITVSAPGYGGKTITAQISGPSGCCGRGPEVDETVTLDVAPQSDAGDGGPVICNGVPCPIGYKCCASADGGVCAPAPMC
jgi:hypothetical protein